MHNSQNQHEVANGAKLNWTMQGLPGMNANLPLALKLDFVILPAGMRGVAVDLEGSQIPNEIQLLAAPVDAVEYGGRTVWITAGNGLEIMFEDEVYTLLRPVEVSDDGKTGVIYFHWYLPREFGGGDIVYDPRQNLEMG